MKFTVRWQKYYLTSKTSAMKLSLPLVSAVLLLASCSTAYKTGQTPDDVYFSPERQREEYVRVKKEDDRQYRSQLQSDEEVREERYLRMKSRYRRYSTLDDCDCYCYNGSNYNRYYDYYRYNNNVGVYHNNWRWNTWNSYNYNPYYYNPYYNNPYYNGVVVGNVRPVYNKPRTGNLNTYNNNNNYNTNVPQSNGKTNSNSATNNDQNYRGSGTTAGGFLRNVFGSGNNNSSSSSTNNNSSSSSPSSTPSSSSSSSSSSGSSSSAPVRKF